MLKNGIEGKEIRSASRKRCLKGNTENWNLVCQVKSAKNWRFLHSIILEKFIKNNISPVSYNYFICEKYTGSSTLYMRTYSSFLYDP